MGFEAVGAKGANAMSGINSRLKPGRWLLAAAALTEQFRSLCEICLLSNNSVFHLARIMRIIESYVIESICSPAILKPNR